MQRHDHGIGMVSGRRRLIRTIVLLGAVLGVYPNGATAQEGRVRCAVTTNGATSTGTIAIVGPGKKTIAGPCRSSLRVPAGTWEATLRLDGALDNPSKTVRVVVTAGEETRVAADFATGTLEVQISARDGRGTGVVTVKRNSHRVGTLGASVPAILSVGSYEIIVQYGEHERRYDVKLRPGQRRLIRAQF